MTTTFIPHRSTAWTAVIDSEGFTLGLATYGEAGYAPFKPDQRRGFNSWAEASAEAEAINTRLGLDPEDALMIQIDTMRRQGRS